MRKILSLLVLTALPVGPLLAQKTNDEAAMMRMFGGGLEGKKLQKAIDKASAYPLGSDKNPVRADGPEGQRDYLARLRCPDGSAPEFDRQGSLGDGVYGYIVDAYSVVCAGAEPVTVEMDMYHIHVEEAAVPGFTIVPSKRA